MSYDDITDSELDAESPVTESLMRRLRDNPLEIAGADAGAPRIRTMALDTSQDREDSGTGLAAAGMVPIAQGDDSVQWGFAAAKGGFAILTTAGWQNVVEVVAGDKYKIDVIFRTRETGDVFYRGSATAIVGEDTSGRWSYVMTQVDESIGIVFTDTSDDSGLVSAATMFRVSGGYIQVNVGYPTGGASSVRWMVTYVRVGDS